MAPGDGIYKGKAESDTLFTLDTGAMRAPEHFEQMRQIFHGDTCTLVDNTTADLAIIAVNSDFDFAACFAVFYRIGQQVANCPFQQVRVGMRPSLLAIEFMFYAHFQFI